MTYIIEAQKLTELQGGSEDALEWFIHRYSGYVAAIIRNILGVNAHISTVEEIASDVFFSLWQHSEKVYEGHVQGFLAVLARNKAKNACRKLGLTVPLDDHILTLDIPGPETQLQHKELNDAIRTAVSAMPSPDREIFLRFYYCYQTAEDISRELNCNLSTVKTKLRRGRQKLKDALDEYIT